MRSVYLPLLVKWRRGFLRLNIVSLYDYIGPAQGHKPDPGAINFTLKVESFMDIIIMH